MSRKSRIEHALEHAFAPSYLEVEDDSAAHAGHLSHHGGAGQGGETHFRVTITAKAFAGTTRIARHRLINDVLKAELASGLHALQIEADAE